MSRLIDYSMVRFSRLIARSIHVVSSIVLDRWIDAFVDVRGSRRVTSNRNRRRVVGVEKGCSNV